MVSRRERSQFLQALRAFHGAGAPQLLERVLARHAALQPDIAFARTSSNPLDRRMELCALFLALIQVLADAQQDHAHIRAVCLDVAARLTRPPNRVAAALKRLPGRVVRLAVVRPLFRLLDRRAAVRAHPDGFAARILTAPEQTLGLGYGVDILECGICKLFHKHGAGAYVSILCEVDFLTSNLAGLQLVRTGTIGQGADRCDFRFRILQD